MLRPRKIAFTPGSWVHSRSGRLTLALATALAALAILSAPGDARSGNRPAPVGGPPTLDFKRCPEDEGNGPCTEPVVIGARSAFNGPVELVAYNSRSGTCLDVDHPAAEISGGFCGLPLRPDSGKSIALAGWSFLSPGPAPDFTDYIGPVSVGTARVSVRYRRNGERRKRNALVTTVDAELAAKLGEDEPFAVFVATLRGCVPTRRVRLTAFDVTGTELGTERERVRRPTACGG
jgi:hypothetical protein